jgi:hypothetical protein
MRTAAIIMTIMVAVYISETSAYFNETKQRYIPGSCHLYTRRSNNVKSHEDLIDAVYQK